MSIPSEQGLTNDNNEKDFVFRKDDRHRGDSHRGNRHKSKKAPVKEDEQTVREDVRPTGEKIPVKKDEHTVRDEVQDYIFLKPKRGKKKKHHTKDGTIKKVHRKRRMKTWKKVLIGVLCGLLALVLIVSGVFAYLVFKGQSELFSDDFNISSPEFAQTDDNGRYVVYNGHSYRLNEKVTNLLFMGVDKRDMDDLGEYGGQGQADVLVMMAYDTKNRKITLINVPRDLMTDVPVYTPSGVYSSTKKQQICLAYAYGDGKETSCNNTVTVMQRLFYNMPVNTYYALDMDGIIAVNDSVGGVDVVSPETIEAFTEGESYHLLGKQAERFVRARRHDTADGNLKRNERQKVYATSFMKYVLKEAKKNLSMPVELFNSSAPYSVTNLNAAKVSYLAKEIVLGGTPSIDIVSVEGDTKINGNYAEFTLKEKEFYELFLSVYYEQIK